MSDELLNTEDALCLLQVAMTEASLSSTATDTRSVLVTPIRQSTGLMLTCWPHGRTWVMMVSPQATSLMEHQQSRRPVVSSTRPPVSLMLFQGRCKGGPVEENSLGCGCSMRQVVRARIQTLTFRCSFPSIPVTRPPSHLCPAGNY